MSCISRIAQIVVEKFNAAKKAANNIDYPDPRSHDPLLNDLFTH